MTPRTRLPEAFEPFLAAPSTAGVFTDFDGTLAPIVAVPEDARPLDGSVGVLEGLAARLGRVAVISGRPVGFLAGFFAAASPVVLSGLYGLQRLEGGERHDDARAGAWREAVGDVVAAGPTGPEGMRVEHKDLSVTLHYRQHPEIADAVREWATVQAIRSGLELRSARMSVELHPPIDADKGTALVDLAGGLESVCFLGDDVGDLPAFEALDRLSETGVRTAKVVVRSSELDPALLGAADVVVDGPEAALGLLAALRDELEG